MILAGFLNEWDTSLSMELQTWKHGLVSDQIFTGVHPLIPGDADKPSHKWHADWTSSAEQAYQFFLSDCHKVQSSFLALLWSTDVTFVGGPSTVRRSEGRRHRTTGYRSSHGNLLPIPC